MAGVYRKFTITGITENQARSFVSNLASVDLRGINGSSVSHNPTTETLIYKIKIEPETLPDGVTAADIRTRIRTYFQSQLSKLPDADTSVTDGSIGLTARDRGRQFIQAVRDDIDPATIGVHGKTLDERKRILRRYAENSKRAFGL